MLTYLNIGLVVQLVIVVERCMRFNNLVGDIIEACEKWYWWIVLFAVIVAAMAVNIILWPATIVCEIILIKHGV